MYHNLIILIQSIQHSSGSSPLPHLPNSCFHFIRFICFPTSFSVSLSLPLCSPALFVLHSTSSLTPIRPLSAICSLKNASNPTSLMILNLHEFLPFSSISALPFSQLSGTPKWLCFLSPSSLSQLLQLLDMSEVAQSSLTLATPWL